MRLTCAKCDAMYEVDDSAISDARREVRCSNCGHAWLQMPAPTESAETAHPADAVADHPQDGPVPPQKRTGPDPDAMRVLREEAERETMARKTEAKSTAMDSALDNDPNVAGSPATPDSLPKPEGFSSAPEGDSKKERMPRKTGHGGGALLPGLIILAAMAAVLVYSFAPQIARLLPQAEASLIIYVELANVLRDRITDLIESAISSVRGATAPDS